MRPLRTLITLALLLLVLVLVLRWAYLGPLKRGYELVAGWLSQARVQVVLENAPSDSGGWDPEPELASRLEEAISDESLAGVIERVDGRAPSPQDLAEARAALTVQPVRGALSRAVLGWRLGFRDAHPERARDVAMGLANRLVDGRMAQDAADARDRVARASARLGELESSGAAARDLERARIEVLRARLTETLPRRGYEAQMRVLEVANLPSGLAGTFSVTGKPIVFLPWLRVASQTLVVLHPPALSLGADPPAESSEARLDRIALHATSRPVLSSRIDELRLYRELSEREVREDVIAHMQRRISIEALPDARGLELRFRHPSAETARTVALAIADDIVERHRHDRDESARRTEDFWRAHLERAARAGDATQRAWLEPRFKAAVAHRDVRRRGGGEGLRRLPEG
ncbi:MAG: hypothetical protein QNK04_08495 [Myxococcota bacterium]|nr:hypothetical protein [Myxococcota bacterium]